MFLELSQGQEAYAGQRADVHAWLAEHPATSISNTGSQGQEVWIDLGETNQEHGLKQVERDDGTTTPANIGGKNARLTVDTQNQGRYIYFNVDNDFLFARETHVVVTVEYFDQGDFAFELQYDSTDTSAPREGQFKPTVHLVESTNSNQWKTVTFDLPDAYFGDRQFDGLFDFRIGVDNNDLYVTRVTVSIP